MAHYELWDLASGNQLNHYEDLFDAMNEVREGIEEDGEVAWYEIGLLRRGDNPADTRRIASGPELVDLALRIAATAQQGTRPASSPMVRESAD